MTLKEAYDAGIRGVRVECNGIAYRRILRCGYRFQENGVPKGYAVLADIPTGRITIADVEEVTEIQGDVYNHYGEITRGGSHAGQGADVFGRGLRAGGLYGPGQDETEERSI